MKYQFDKSIILILIFFYGVAMSQADVDAKQDSQLKTYEIGIFANPPLSFINGKGSPDGYVVDIFEEIALKENFKIKWVLDNWKNVIHKLKTNKLDMITSVAYSKDRTKIMKYSKNTFIVGWSQVFLPLNSNIETFLDLNNKTIAVLNGGINGKSLISRCKKFEINCRIVSVDTYEEAFKKVSNGEVDATISNNSVGIWYLDKYQIVTSSIIFNPTRGYIAIPKGGNDYLLDVFDKYIKEWKADTNSYIYTAKTKWLSPKYTNTISNNLIYSIIGLTLFALFTLLSALVYKRQVSKRAKEISIRNQQFSQIINLVPHIIYVSDSNGNILLANKKSNTYFGMTKEEIQRCNIENFRKYSDTGKGFLNDNNLSKNLKGSDLKEIQTKDYLGNNYNLLLSKMPFTGLGNDQNTFITVAVDITEIKKYQKQIMQLAHYNSLTNLPNQTLFKSRLQTSLKKYDNHNKFGSVLYLDLDSFKNLNDAQGHKVGDKVIKIIADRIINQVPEAKTIAHFGGDEFIIDIPKIDTEDDISEILAHQIGDNLLEIISQPIKIHEMVFQITASIGIVIYPRDGKTESLLFQRAYTALNNAKKMGRNNIQFFNRELELHVKNNHKLETELRNALTESQFKIVYQPIIEGSRNKVVGAEALLRWEHPVKGTIGPGEFIEIAEKIHLIVKIGDWVLDQACQKIKQHIDQGESFFFIAVNVSVLQIKDKGFYNKVAYLIQKYGIPPNHLELELTESVLMEDVELSISIFNKLKLLGIKISIDDFGTGYSSFNYLMKLPIDKLKIDQSFVKVLPMDNNSATIVKTIIKMAKELRMNVVAEGIENQGQYDFLINHGCRYFQGYYLHRPMEFDEIAKLN